MATPGAMSSPLPAYLQHVVAAPPANAPSPATLLGLRQPAPPPAKATPPSNAALDDAAPAEFRLHLAALAASCDALQAQSNAAFDAVDRSFAGGDAARREHIVGLLQGLEALRQQLVATGAGALPALDPARVAAPDDLDADALLARRAKEAQASFAAGERARAAAQAVADVLGQPARLS